MKHQKKIATTIVALLVILLGRAWGLRTLPTKPYVQAQKVVQEVATPQVAGEKIENATWMTVGRVVDGDTIELSTGEKIRYIGINTPETVDPRRGVQCFGHEASAFNKKFVEGKRVRLEADVTDKDKYGRLLRYVYLEDGTFVNLALVEQGYADVYTYPPNVRYSAQFRAAALSARHANLGLWGACPH
jgi:micrococcal nuclease